MNSLPKRGVPALMTNQYDDAVALRVSELRIGKARGRYFRENYAQSGFDLVQIIPELVTNADAAIAASGVRRDASC